NHTYSTVHVNSAVVNRNVNYNNVSHYNNVNRNVNYNNVNVNNVNRNNVNVNNVNVNNVNRNNKNINTNDARVNSMRGSQAAPKSTQATQQRSSAFSRGGSSFETRTASQRG